MLLKNKLIKVYQSSYFELITVFVITLLMILRFSILSEDEVWIYGFSYNIANGLIPYKDFNMVVTPLYPLLQGLFMFIFEDNMITYHIVNSLICTGIFYLLKKLYSNVYYIIYIFLLFAGASLFTGYNLFIFFLLLIVLYLEKIDGEKMDFLIGIILGLIFITKQNMGILLFLPTLTIFNFKRVAKRFLGFMIPIISMILYLFLTHSFLQFFDYAILGIFDFKKNLTCDATIIFFCLSLVYCIYQVLIKKNKDMMIRYFICFLLMGYPLFDFGHILFPFSIILAYFLNQFHHQKEVYKILFYGVYLVIITSKLIYSNYVVIESGALKYRIVDKDTNQYLENISKKLNNYYEDEMIDNIYFFADYAYFLKLHNEIPLNKFDLINKGNMGYNGEIKYIEEFRNNCLNKKCIFITKSNYEKNAQISNEIIEYVEDNYDFIESFEHFNVYKN